MSRERLVLAVDLGTSGCKCALATLSGEIRAWAFRPVALHVAGVAAEQDPEDWWRALVGAAGELFARTPESRRSIAAVSSSTQGEGTVCVDRDGRAIGRALTWLDMRGATAIARRAGASPLRVAGYGPLALWRWLCLTGGAPALSGKDSAGHIAYIRACEPERYERTHKFLNVLDYINLRLAGRFAATRNSILTTWVTDNRNGACRYDSRLIAQLGVDRDKLPEIVGSTDTLGPLRPEAAEALGLARDVVVIAGAIDNSAVAVGAGAVRDFETHLYLGTSSWLGAHLAVKKTDLASKIAAVPCAIEGRYLATALQSAAGANLSFFRDRILYHPDELSSDEQRPDVYQALDRIAASVPAGARGLLYTPWLFGERAPVEDATLRAGLLNLSLEHSRADIVRAFLEGVALNTRWMLEPFERFVGRANAPVTVVGGGAQSDLWCQILADATGRTIRQPETPIEANAMGAAFIAAVGLGALTFDDVPALIRWRRDYTPDPGSRALYDERFACFKDAYRRLSPLYRRLNAPRRPPS